jgi:hypothetical protein
MEENRADRQIVPKLSLCKLADGESLGKLMEDDGFHQSTSTAQSESSGQDSFTTTRNDNRQSALDILHFPDPACCKGQLNDSSNAQNDMNFHR